MRAKKPDRNLRHFQFSDLPIRLRCSCSSFENLFDIFFCQNSFFWHHTSSMLIHFLPKFFLLAPSKVDHITYIATSVLCLIHYCQLPFLILHDTRSTTSATRILCLLPKKLLPPYIQGRPHELHSNKVSQILRFQLLNWGCAECTLYTKHKAGQIKQYKCKTKNLQNLTEVTSVPNYCIESILLYTH